MQIKGILNGKVVLLDSELVPIALALSEDEIAGIAAMKGSGEDMFTIWPQKMSEGEAFRQLQEGV